ncbi:MAG: MBL fold metallo-hydrolase [Ignavibacteria bacterium]|nr:MBL fold metallo-hydrolase [Ignavibacteria bacterium]
MTIQFLGAARSVTGSMHLVSANGSTILLDCGLFQGRRSEAFDRNKTFPFDAPSIDAVILSHAHIDHAGNLPNLVRSGYRDPIYATAATRDLCNIMLYDSAFLQQRDVEFVNKRHKKKNEALVEPLYTEEDVDETIDQFVSIGYRQAFQVAPGIVLQFFDAGHILGSAAMLLEVEHNGRTQRIGFTGDLGRKDMPILRDPQPIGDVDYLICESTYGGKNHDPATGMRESLLRVVKEAVEQGGKIIIPSFSVGRTQELIYKFFQLCDEGRLPPIPVYVDSPLAVNATDVFRMHSECFDKEMMRYLRQHEDPFGFGRLTYIRSVDDSKALNDRHDPCVIIAASGMCEGGRILHHLANNIQDSRNTVLIVGFMAEHTLGRRLVERQAEVRIFGEPYQLRARVEILNAFSAHAGGDELTSYVQTMDPALLKGVFLVHGELDRAEALAKRLNSEGYSNVSIPVRGQKVVL